MVIHALDGLDRLAHQRIYPLAAADDPPETGFVDSADASFNGIHANDFSFFEEVNEILPEEAQGALDPERAGQLAALGIVHGRPFAPDAPPARDPRSSSPSRGGDRPHLSLGPGDPDVYIFEGALLEDRLRRRQLRVPRQRGADAQPPRSDALRRHRHHPCDDPRRPRLGSQYAYTVDDANGETLDGRKDYTLTLPAPIPVKTFWAIDIYDTQTRSLLQTDNPYPSINDRFGDLHTGPRRRRDPFGPNRRLSPTSTGCGRSRARAGSRSCASTDRSSLVRPDLATRRDPTRVAGARASSADRADGRRRGGWLTTTSPDSATVPSAVAEPDDRLGTVDDRPARRATCSIG